MLYDTYIEMTPQGSQEDRQMTTENKLHSYEATESGITLEDAVRGFTNGEPAALKGMTGEEIEAAWNEAGEQLPWDAEDIVTYVESL
jgi:hypothetical protein